MTGTIKRLALTPGEPAGIGPDLVVRLAAGSGQAATTQLVVIADPDLLAARAQQLGLTLTLLPFDPEAAPALNPPRSLTVMPVALRQPVTPGVLNAANAEYVLETLARACDGCLDDTFAGLVTAPVHKGIINDAGLPFTGHTEFLADRCAATPVMLLATPELRVALVTTHLPLTAVSSAITAAHLTQVLTIIHHDLRHRFGIAAPRLRVCGLNPHAGENGHLGREELDIIIPVLTALRAQGMNIEGPVPADTAFVAEHLAHTDVIVTMYHDQGLPVLKHLGFGRAVNVTLGLPIVRTSVDHGTALTLAGTDRADLGSLYAALTLAQTLV